MPDTTEQPTTIEKDNVTTVNGKNQSSSRLLQFSYTHRKSTIPDTTRSSTQSTRPSTPTAPTTPEVPTTEVSTTERPTESTTEPSTVPTDTTTTTSLPDTTELNSYQTFNVECSRNSLKINRNVTLENDGEIRDNSPIFGREHELNDTIKIVRPKVSFEFADGRSNSEIMIRFDPHTMENYYGMFLIYYPGFMMSNDVTDENVRKNVRCRIVMSEETLINELLPSTIYTFCAILRDQLYISPFQCKSSQSQSDRAPWLYEEQKVCKLQFIGLMII